MKNKDHITIAVVEIGIALVISIGILLIIKLVMQSI